MKILILTAFILGAYVCLTECQSHAQLQQQRDELLRRAQYLTTLISGEVKLLTLEGNTLSASGLQLELEGLIELEIQLRATEITNVTDSQLNQLNTVLTQVEMRIGQLLTQIGRQFYSRIEINFLLERVSQLIDTVAFEVKRLKSKNATLEAAGLEREETNLIELQVAIRSTFDSNQIRRLEELLAESGYRVVEIIIGLHEAGVRRKRDLKDDILKRADELIALANSSVIALRQQNRNVAADLIQQSQRNLQLVANDLRLVNSSADIVRLEAELVSLEIQLTYDLQAAGRPVSLEEYRLLLLTTSQALQQLANYEIGLLRSANTTNATAEIALIETQERVMVTLSGEVNNATNRAQLEQLEQRLIDAEFFLYETLLRLASPEAYRRQLLVVAEELAVRIMTEVRALSFQNRILEAEGLIQELQQLSLFDVQLRNAITNAEIRELESQLQAIEQRIYMQLRAMGNRNRRKRDLKDDVLKRAQELITIANNTVRVLQNQRNRTAAVELIQGIEREIQALVGELRNATNASDITRLETRLIQLEFRLTENLRTIGQPVDVQEYRALLLTAADGLRQWANTELETLRKANNTNDTQLLIQNELRVITDVANELKNATTRAELERLELRLSDVEFRLYETLLRIQSPEAYRRQLIDIAEELAVRAAVETRTLVERNRTLEAEGLIAELQQLIQLDVQLRDAVTNAEIQAIETRLQQIEERIFLILNGLPATGVRTLRKRDLKADVLKRADELVNITTTAVQNFLAENRTNAALLLNQTETRLKQLAAQLRAATNQSQVDQLEGQLLTLEFQLADDLRRLGRPIDVAERRELLLTAADGLLRYATSQIAMLKAQNRSLAVERIEDEVKAINALMAELRTANTEASLYRLEQSLSDAETRFYEELQQLNVPVISLEDRDRLLVGTEELAIRLILEIRKLEADGKILLADGLREEEHHMVQLDVQIRVAITPEEIIRLEARLREEQGHVTRALAQVNAALG